VCVRGCEGVFVYVSVFEYVSVCVCHCWIEMLSLSSWCVYYAHLFMIWLIYSEGCREIAVGGPRAFTIRNG
jgi:hypothetical protein